MNLTPTSPNKIDLAELPRWNSCPAAVFLCGDSPAFGTPEEFIASAHSLITLEGKPLQRKRSLIRQFKAACGDWRFEPLSPQNIDAAFQVERLWQREEQGEAGAFTRRCFRYCQEQGLMGGILYHGVEPLGYAMAARCAEAGAVLLVLRAKAAPAGVSAMLYQQLAVLLREQLPRLQWVNLGRMGGPAEQQNRISYHPRWIINDKGGR